MKLAQALAVLACIFGTLQLCSAHDAPHAGTAGRWTILGDYDDKPSNVRALQYLLRAQKFPIAVDGRFGEQTENQVRKFQLGKRIKTTPGFAVVDAQTWEALISDLKRGDKGWAVCAVQTLLRSSGFKVTLDGYYGPQTEQAVHRFQIRRDLLQGVVPPGRVEHFTWCALAGGQFYTGDAG